MMRRPSATAREKPESAADARTPPSVTGPRPRTVRNGEATRGSANAAPAPASKPFSLRAETVRA
jgi:hypothetical protein